MARFDLPYTTPKATSGVDSNTLDTTSFLSQAFRQELAGVWNTENFSMNVANVYALRPGKDPEAMRAEPARIMEEGLKGNLFTVDKNGFMRQITLNKDENDRYQFNVSAPMTQPQAPTKPSRFTRWFAWLVPSFRDEVNEYKRQLAMTTAIYEFGTSPEHSVNFNPTDEDIRTAPKEPRKPKAPVDDAAWEREILNQLNQQKGPDIRSMNTNEFFSHLSNTLSMANANSGALRKVATREDGAPIDYYKLVTDTLLADTARALVFEANKQKTPKEKEAFLNNNKEFFISASAGLRNYAVKNTNHETVRAFYEDRSDTTAYSKLRGEMQKIEATGVKGYMEQVKEQNQLNNQTQKSQPQQQIQQPQQQIQQNQPKAEPQAPSVGGRRG